MGGIQGPVALPGDPIFETENRYDVPSYRRICDELGRHNTDFRFFKRKNHGLGNVYAWFTTKEIPKLNGLNLMAKIYYFLMREEKLAMVICFHLIGIIIKIEIMSIS
mgnify:CR=1 FL=1